MMRIFYFAVVIAFLFTGIQVPAQTRSRESSLKNDILKIDGLIKEYASNRLFNGSALVERKGKVILRRGYGMADMEWNIPNAPTTKFRIGSISKQFTATLILLLEQEGKIDLDAKITDYLPWYRKDTGNKITVRNLLGHTSGIPNYTAKASVMNDIAINSYSPREIAEKYCSDNPEFEPGTKFSYSNSGYYLLGVIVETITKKTYAENLDERIFGPLKMKNSGVESPTALVEHRADGYEYGLDGFQKTAFIDMESAIFSAGAIYSTVDDLNVWENALFGDKLLSKVNKERMFNPALGKYGLGLYINKSKTPGIAGETTAIGHSGGINGFSAFLIRFVEAETTVILLDNTRVGKRGNLENISLGIQKILNGLPPDKLRKSIQVAMTEGLRNGSTGEQLVQFYRETKSASAADYSFDGLESYLLNLGYWFFKKGRVRESLIVHKLAVDEFPKSPNAFVSLAGILASEGQPADARRNYMRALELDPENAIAIAGLKELEVTQQRTVN